MRLKNTLSAIAAATMIAAFTMTAAGPAAAAGDTAPACVAREVVKQDKTAWTTNNCGRNMHIKLVIDHGPDQRCWTTFPGETLKWTWKMGSYGRIAVC
ncbi:hypothetical protein ACFVW8_35465 [Streptomyces sp. NPDC058221]|uniref:hypothetical protein n=1 Tax=Streptomyces sp. NPDC058221 TaxID=3346388 RepID=UPI0036ECA269